MIRLFNDCCTFSWREPEGGGTRVVEVLPDHCERCIHELESQGYALVPAPGASRRHG